MSLFFFDFDEGEGSLRDDLGTEFPDGDSARRGALQALASIARDMAAEIEPPHQLKVIVRDGSGKPIYRAALTISDERIA